MENSRNNQNMDSITQSEESRLGECESYWVVSGPPYDQRDYMVSPSDSSSCLSQKESTGIAAEPVFGPCNETLRKNKYVLDWQGALKKIIELIRSGHAQTFTSRIGGLIRKYLAGCCSGFLIDDLPLVVEVLEYFSRNKDSDPVYEGFVKDIICEGGKNPPLVTKSSDILKSKKIVTDYFTVLGEILATFEDDFIQTRTLEAIERLACRRESSNPAAIKLSVCHEALEESQLPYVMAVLLETVSQDLYVRYLDIIIQIVLVSVKAAYIMIQCNVLNALLWRLNYCTVGSLSTENPKTSKEETVLRDYYILLEKSSYAIWGLSTILKKGDENVPCPDEDSMLSLRIVFEREAIKKSSKAVSMRNNLAGILVRLCGAFGGKLPVFETGLAVDMAVMAVATEMGAQGTWIEPCKLGASNEDYILKELMMLGCCLIIENEKCVETLKSFKVIEGILGLIDPRKTTPWIPSQFITLFYTALRILAVLVPLMPEVFVLNRGTTNLLSAMKWSMEKHSDKDFILEILDAISVIVTSSTSGCVVDDILAQDGPKFFLDLCFYILEFESIKLDDQKKLTRIFTILEKIVGKEGEFAVKYGTACTSIALTLLKRIINDSSFDSKWNPQLLISFGGFIWEWVAWTPSSRTSFITQGGIFLLLDIIETNSFPVQMLFLGILVEMSDSRESISHLTTWRGKEGFGVLDSLIGIWRREEGLTKVARTKEGIIQDLDMPLMTQEQWYLTHQVRGSHRYSPSIAEMCCSARPKIHALYQCLQKRYGHLTDLSESFYSLSLKKVRPSYKLYIPLIEHFFQLKMGEVWYEVLRDATYSGVIPTADDGDALCTLLDEKNQWSARIKTMQEEIYAFEKTNTAAEEKELYNLLKANNFSNSLEALGELDYVARTSNKKFQEEKKRKQIEEVENSLRNLSEEGDVNLHRTFVCKTNATCFAGNYVKIRSEKEVTEHEDIVLVSSDESGDDRFDLDYEKSDD